MSRAAQAVRRRPVPVLVGAAVVLAVGGAALWSLRRPPVFHPPASVDALARELDRVVPAALREHRVPGATVAIVHDGEVRWSAAYGTADAGRRTPMRPDTVLQVASISKPVAALTALRLARAGALDLDRPVHDFTGTWRLPASEHDPRGVTLRRLLSHTAGVEPDGYEGLPPGTPLPSTREALAGASGEPVRLAREPGTRWSYSGGGYTVAQLAVEETTGEPWATAAGHEVLEPLAMDRSGFECTSAETPEPQAARGHDPRGRPVAPRRFPDQAAAGLCSTAADIGRLAAALMDGPEGAQMAAPAPGTGGHHGLGLFTQELRDGSRRFWHDGANPGFRARVEAYPEQGWAVAVLTNGDNGNDVLEDVTRLLAR